MKQQPFTHVQQLSIQKGGRILTFVSSQNEMGLPFYAYIITHKDGFQKLESAMQKGKSVDFEEIGEVIHKDWGNTPTDEIKQAMEESFAFTQPE